VKTEKSTGTIAFRFRQVLLYIEQNIGSQLKLFSFIQWYVSEKSENLCSKLFIVQTLLFAVIFFKKLFCKHRLPIFSKQQEIVTL